MDTGNQGHIRKPQMPVPRQTFNVINNACLDIDAIAYAESNNGINWVSPQ
jgi:hypothetical protein